MLVSRLLVRWSGNSIKYLKKVLPIIMLLTVNVDEIK